MSETTTTSHSIIIEAIRILPDVLWVILSLIIFIYSYRLAKEYILPKMKNLSVFGITVELLSEHIDAIIQVAEKNDKWNVRVSESSKINVIKRTRQNLYLFKNVAILWFDDKPETITNEINMFNQIGVTVDITSSLDQTLNKLSTHKYDLLITDIARENDQPNGITTLQQINKAGYPLKTIFYIGTIDHSLGTPPYGFGITNRPDELLHLVLDIIERKLQ